MTKSEISDQAIQRLEKLSEQAEKSVDELVLWFLDNYGEAAVTTDN